MNRQSQVLFHVMWINKLILWRVRMKFDETYPLCDSDLAFSSLRNWVGFRRH